jgi:hypothetical protein
LEGDAFLHSQIKEIPGFCNAFSKEKSPFSVDNARFFISAADSFFFACSVRYAACSANCSKIFAIVFSQPFPTAIRC